MSFHMQAGSMLLWLILTILPIAGMWKIFDKAGQPGWAAIVPFYNLYILVMVAEKQWWWFILFFIPVVNIVPLFVINFTVAERFGKGIWYGLLLVFLPFIGYPLLGFGDATYQGSQQPERPTRTTQPETDEELAP